MKRSTLPVVGVVVAMMGLLASCQGDSGCEHTLSCPREVLDAGRDGGTLEVEETTAETAPTDSDADEPLSPVIPVPLNPETTALGDAGLSGSEPPGTSLSNSEDPVEAGTGLADGGDVANPVDAGSDAGPGVVGLQISGQATGLAGTLTLDVAGELVVLEQDGSFSVDGFAVGDNYAVVVDAAPSGQVCSVSNGEGLFGENDVDGVSVSCLNDVATLSDLVATPALAFAPAFNQATDEYNAEVSLFTSTIELLASLTDPTASLSINGVSAAPGIAESFPVPLGQTLFSIEVTAPSGRVQTYAVDVTRRDTLAAPQELVSPVPVETDGFGSSVSNSADVMFVDRDSSEDVGAQVDGPEAFLFHNVAGNWTYVATVEDLISDPVFAIQNGEVCGDVLAVTAIPTEDSLTQTVYLLIRQDNEWVYQEALTGFTDITDIECDGAALAIRDVTEVSLFDRGALGWEFLQSFAIHFSSGQSLALSGTILVVGNTFDSSVARGIDGNPNSNCSIPEDCADGSGAAWILERSPEALWQQAAYVKASNALPYDSFGRAVGVFGNTVAISAPGEHSTARGVLSTAPIYDCNTAGSCNYIRGAVYLYQRVEGVWSEVAYIKGPSNNLSEFFGRTLALSSDILAIGASSWESVENGLARGAVYLFHFDGDEWLPLTPPILAPDTMTDDPFAGVLGLTNSGLFGSAFSRPAGQDKVFWFAE